MWIALVLTSFFGFTLYKYPNIYYNILKGSKYIFDTFYKFGFNKTGYNKVKHIIKEYLTFQIYQNFIENSHLPGSRQAYTINYPFMMDWYKIIVKKKSGPCLLVGIKDSNGNDVYEQIKPYIGPGHDFHGGLVKLTPDDLGYSGLTFEYINGNKKTFDKYDELIV